MYILRTFREYNLKDIAWRRKESNVVCDYTRGHNTCARGIFVLRGDDLLRDVDMYFAATCVCHVVLERQIVKFNYVESHANRLYNASVSFS